MALGCKGKRNMNKKEAYRIVFEDLKKFDMFRGRYDAKNGSKQLMHGISAVMEVIASTISDECHDEFVEEFLKNMLECEDAFSGDNSSRFACDNCVCKGKTDCENCQDFDHFIRKNVVKRRKETRT